MLFDPQPGPRVFGIPPGRDFALAFAAALRERAARIGPEALGRTLVLVNNRRTAKQIETMLGERGEWLLPRVLAVTDLGRVMPVPGLTAGVSALRRRLQLTRAVQSLIEAQPGLAPPAAALDLAATLADLMAEMQEEGVSPETLRHLDVGDMAEHWTRSLRFIELIASYFGPGMGDNPDAAARQRWVVEAAIARWTDTPPSNPIIVAGSTGSRGTTRLLMRAVAGLPQGAVVLPGYDYDLPPDIRARLTEEDCQDHPQYRFARIQAEWGLGPENVPMWDDGIGVTNPERNRLISLALRPAPVTDQWIVEGPQLPDLAGATDALSLIEAPNPRLEAGAIAVAIRDALASRCSVALVTPDRRLTRQVQAALDQWHLVPDDSAGEPLSQTAQGRLARHLLSGVGRRLSGEDIIVLVKHPLVGRGDRGPHLRQVRLLEAILRRDGPPFPGPRTLRDMAETRGGREPPEAAWLNWLADGIAMLAAADPAPMAQHLARLEAMIAHFNAGPEAEAPRIWGNAPGMVLRRQLDALTRDAEAMPMMTAEDFARLVDQQLGAAEVRHTVEVHPDLRFWGTLEARVQGADVVILAGLNEGVWPGTPAQDPWMNRRMRKAAGLTLPERRIGLAAHDFQQAISGATVILSRARRDEAAETVPSRWLSRLCNLLAGLTAGEPALKGMRERGAVLVNRAGRLSLPDAAMRQQMPPARRPAPCPPVDARPKRLSVTDIQTLIRDPYAIYARTVLGLRPLDPLRPLPDARDLGNVFHRILENFVRETMDDPALITPETLMATADRVLESVAYWPGQRLLWRAKINRNAQWIVATEQERRTRGVPAILEIKREMGLTDPKFTLVGKVDRIDRLHDGSAEVVDYKTGTVPKDKALTHYDKQLLLEAVMIEAGVFDGISGPVKTLTHIGLGASPEAQGKPVPEGAVDEAAAQLRHRLSAMLDPKTGFMSRRLMADLKWGGDYDSLARFGEWTESDDAVLIHVGKGDDDG